MCQRLRLEENAGQNIDRRWREWKGNLALVLDFEGITKPTKGNSRRKEAMLTVGEAMKTHYLQRHESEDLVRNRKSFGTHREGHYIHEKEHFRRRYESISRRKTTGR